MSVLRASRLLPLALAATIGLAAGPARAEGSRWIAALPFGAGQFQNGDFALGIVFSAGEAALAGLSIATAVRTHLLTSHASNGPPDLAALNSSLRTSVLTNQIAFGGWGALTVAGIAEAQVRFVPRRDDCGATPCPSVTATLAPFPGGALLGIRGAF
jgi:hypothetical protein